MELYEEGYELKEDEYLFKIRYQHENVDTGFLTKFNQNGSIPIAFKDWGVSVYWDTGDSLPSQHNRVETKMPKIYVFKEEFRSGWKLNSWRFGKSRNWVSLIHPEGFTLEIHLSKFLNIVKDNIIINGEIQGKFKWIYSDLIRKK